jgi:hypothetical protein
VGLTLTRLSAIVLSNFKLGEIIKT